MHLPPGVYEKIEVTSCKLTLVDLEPVSDDPVKILADITRKYAAISDEKDLDIEEIYKQRKCTMTREFV